MEYSEAIIKFLVGVIFAWFWHDKNKSDAEFKAHKRDINNKVDALRISQAAHETQLKDIALIKASVAEMGKLLNELTVELRSSNAIRDQERQSR